MDIQMPEVDGLTATRTIRRWESDHGLSPTPIIALTASVLEEDVRLALASGCNLHMSKPVRKRVLLDAVRNAALLRKADTPESVPVTDAMSAEPQPNGRVSGQVIVFSFAASRGAWQMVERARIFEPQRSPVSFPRCTARTTRRMILALRVRARSGTQ